MASPTDRARSWLSLAPLAIAAAILGAPAPAQELTVQGPLNAMVAIPAPGGACAVGAAVTVPADAPADLAVAGWASDRDGGWFQSARWIALGPGEHRLSFSFARDADLQAMPGGARWDAEAQARVARCGLCFSTASLNRAHLRVDALTITPVPVIPDGPPLGALVDLAADATTLACGERWQCTVRPEPFPENPYDPGEFSLDAEILSGDGARWEIPGFCLEPMRERDRGDRLALERDGESAFAVRFRPSRPGRYQVRLLASWRGAPPRTVQLLDLEVHGPPKDGCVRIDATDGRFFAIDGAFAWPIGINLHSPFDQRSKGVLNTILTPDRGELVYQAMLPRVAAAGIDACEIWMSAWNLGLEWRADWPGFDGIGRYNQGHAWELDRILDCAWANGVRVNLVINNHGQASASSDREWLDNPWNAQLGGPLESPQEVFSDPRSLAGQERLRRYIIGRWADHPAIMGWKLWSEVDLTAARGEIGWRWHEQAAVRWHALDPYHHPVTSHWAGDFRRVNPAVAVLPGIDYLCIDAYRHADANGAWRMLADILADSATYPGSGLDIYGKPILTSEFGAGAGGSPSLARLVDHLTGPWAALVSGHAGAPMLWWWEWVDQGSRWQPYRAIRNFVQGEDLRGGRAAILDAHPDTRVWARAWAKRGRVLGYVLDRSWGADGVEAGAIRGATIDLGARIAPGQLQLSWWDPMQGVAISTVQIAHAGGALRIPVPTFSHHLAFKVVRLGGEPSAAQADAGAGSAAVSATALRRPGAQ